MSEEVPETEEPIAPRSITLIGDELRAARVARSMEISEVARRLNLEEHVVVGLEQTNYESLPEVAYIRGYLLAYIRLMDLPESLIKHFDEEHPLNVMLVSPTAKKRSACSGEGRAKCVTTGIFVLLLVIAGIWGVDQYLNHPQTMTEQQTSTEMPATDSVMEDESTAVSEPQAESLTTYEPVFYDTVSDEPEVEAAESAPADVVGTSEVIQTTEETADSEVAATEPDIESEVQTEEPDAVPQTPVLIINFLDTSWVSISDSNGKQLQGGTYKKGHTINFEHEGELRLIIGRASNVEVTYAGNPVDLSSYASVARLSLGHSAQ
jgi:cytoskeleton protein RodZ